MVTGVSTHSLDTSLRAEQEGADYVIFGPIFPTASKAQFGAPQGLGPLKVVCSRLKIPVIAVGGISPNETNNCYKAGAYGIACINALLLSQDIKATINRFLNPETVVHIDKVMSEEENK
jgi:thiamine-phosphate pyrophosphorylase